LHKRLCKGVETFHVGKPLSPASPFAFLYAALQTTALKKILWVKRKRRGKSEGNSRRKHPVPNGTNICKKRFRSRQEIQIVCTESCFATENSSKLDRQKQNKIKVKSS